MAMLPSSFRLRARWLGTFDMPCGLVHRNSIGCQETILRSSVMGCSGV